MIALGACAAGLSRVQTDQGPFEKPLTRPELYALRDQSGLSRSEFYARHFTHEEDVLETGMQTGT